MSEFVRLTQGEEKYLLGAFNGPFELQYSVNKKLRRIIHELYYEIYYESKSYRGFVFIHQSMIPKQDG